MTEDIIFRSRFKVPSGVSAVKVKAELDKINKANKGITPEAVIEAAKLTKSELHKCFMWDNSKAANEYRKVQARSLIRCIWVVPIDRTKSASNAFCYVPDSKLPANKPTTKPKRNGVYRPTPQVTSSEDMFQSALGHLARKMHEALYAINSLEQAARATGNKKRIAVIAMVVKSVSLVSKAVDKLSEAA